MKKDKFLSEYQNHTFRDDGCYLSEDFKSFARKFRNYLNRNLPEGCEILNHRIGHYDLSGFVRMGEKYAYYSYSWNRFSPVDVREGSNPRSAVLYRTAAGSSDYRGGFNRFASIEDAPAAIASILKQS